MRSSIHRSLALLSLLAAALALSCQTTTGEPTPQDRLEAADWKVERAQARAIEAEERARDLERQLAAANARIEELELELASETGKVTSLRDAATGESPGADGGELRPATANAPADETTDDEKTTASVDVSSAALRQLTRSHDQFVRAFEQAERAYDGLYSDLRNIRLLPGNVMSEAGRIQSNLSGLRRQTRQVSQEIGDLSR